MIEKLSWGEQGLLDLSILENKELIELTGCRGHCRVFMNKNELIELANDLLEIANNMVDEVKK